ncbi:valyl-tRNA synthetase [Sphingomonas vulcanisoli]|uniref:Valine--tRNA ligase n=1 Tax=Sphingomonas vulcanisoli TaxID=1658060 RepID=A0ABX0TU84_9SPHN|nr:valine--tRNA ligase [Sphingomonas vulcanisoli]NIJ09077.1 valyl-tRNA synthetase [Sphingomonas vulcanisoli]
MTIDKTFDPAGIEAHWYPYWESRGLFRPAREDREPFTIVIPPPNVTGSLHIGHALDNTLQDILIRHARLQGKDALWVVGTDHAGIATQMVVERNIASQGLKRQEMGREAFLDHVWEWKATSGGQITRQLRRLGASCDWANERFTMDEGFSKAVVKVFVDLYNQGLLYRDKRLVNWDPHFRTAISDLEVETREVNGKFWHLRYPLADGSGSISVATTRPETMLADMAVAVNPEDARYKALIGKQVCLPITGRLIPIVADDHADPELGSGAVKITPGHDFNDFEVGKRAGFKAAEMLNMLDASGAITQTADGLIPADLLGLDRFEARDVIVKLLEEAGALEKVEDRVIQTPYGDRSGVVIEPWLTDQWYVDAKALAGPAIEAVRSGAIRVVPETWKKTWYQWLENIQPWCVSRQLWWGHQIPAWFGPGLRDDGSLITGDVIRVDANWRPTTRMPISEKIFVADSDEEALAQARAYYPNDATIRFSDDWEDRGQSEANTVVLRRDRDVLDTWFSSALWPFATLGWPDGAPQTPFVPSEVEGRTSGGAVERVSTTLDTIGRGAASAPAKTLLARHYPNDVLISGFDILFFWDARMAMQGLHFMGEAPWKTLYLHGLVRAPDGSKMSKSKGNTVDPLGLIDKYGADALRFTLAAMESQGRDIKLDEKRVEGYRNFATKLWNAARFAQSNGIGGSTRQEPPEQINAVDKWIVAETVRTVQALDLALADLRFDEAANTVYQFVWAQFCDWYLELIKPGLGNEMPGETKAVAGWVLDRILVMLHPFMPFITEELWRALAARDHDLIVAEWPKVDAVSIDQSAVAEVEWLIRLVSAIRAARADVNVPPGARTNLIILEQRELKSGDLVSATPNPNLIDRVRRQAKALSRLARIDNAEFISTGIAIQLATGTETDRITYQPSLKGRLQVVVDGIDYILLVGDLIDLVAEEARLRKNLEAAEKEAASLAGRLNNPSFVEKAKPEAVAKAREDHAAKSAEAERLRAALARLG